MVKVVFLKSINVEWVKVCKILFDVLIWWSEKSK